MSEENILVRVYKDVEVKNNDDYIENAIAIATEFSGDFDVEIIQEPEKPKTTQEYFDECLTRWSKHVKR